MTSQANGYSSIFNVTLPPEGPRAIPFNVDFSVNVADVIDITQLINDGWVTYISGVYFDNSLNDQPVTLVCNGSNQKLIIPANGQGWFPLHATNPPVFNVSVPSVGDICKFQFVNFPVWPYVIPNASGSASDTNINIAEIGGDAVTGPNLPVISASPTITDYSGALTGGSDEFIAAGDGLNYVAIYNPLTNAPIMIDLSGGDATANGVVLNGGGSLTLDQGCANAITISGTAAQTISVYGGVVV